MTHWTAWITRRWYGERPSAWLCPFARLYAAVVWLRRLAYRRGWLASERVGVPVLVVGNVTVGGSGKTPLTLAVVERLVARGRRVGIVSRGYGGRTDRYPLLVRTDSDAAESGDEPLLIARRSGVAVAVDPVRTRAARWLVARCGVDIVVADDGLQHYALARDAEICVVDARRGLGNGWLLPAGPLREPASRAATADLELVNGESGDFWLAPADAQALCGDARRPLASFAGERVHALAGIGDPQRFFDMLRGLGIDVIAHAMPDHHRYTTADLRFDDDRPVLMTEKDAVKCAALADRRHWMVPVAAIFSESAERRLAALLDRLCVAHGSANG